jgi:hypothetical protein
MLRFSKDVLRCIIVAKLPNIYIIAHEPYAGGFVNKFLLKIDEDRVFFYRDSKGFLKI